MVLPLLLQYSFLVSTPPPSSSPGPCSPCKEKESARPASVNHDAYLPAFPLQVSTAGFRPCVLTVLNPTADLYQKAEILSKNHSERVQFTLAQFYPSPVAPYVAGVLTVRQHLIKTGITPQNVTRCSQDALNYCLVACCAGGASSVQRY